MSRVKSLRWRRLAAMAALSAFAGVSSAAALELSPLTIVLNDDAPVRTLLLTNDTTKDAAYQITGMDWSQADGESVHSTDTDLIVTPPIVSLAPGESVIVRVGLMDLNTDEQEASYRLLIRDITQLRETGAPLRVRTQLLLGVFVRPKDLRPEIEIAETLDLEGRACLDIQNRGNVHQKLVSVRPADGSEGAVAVQQYVLAGAGAEVCPVELEGKLARKKLRAGFTTAYSNKVEYHDVSLPGPGTGTRALASLSR